MKNSTCYWKLEKFSLRYVHYAFVDVHPYLADQLFCDHRVTVRFGDEYGRGDTDYRIVFCKVRKRDERAFLAALEELPDKMLLCGHLDYMDFCRTLGQAIGAEEPEEPEKEEGVQDAEAGTAEQAE